MKKQTYPDIEIIVVDTNSTDGTVRFCEDNEIKLLKSEWKTLGSRYIGLINCSGNYVLLLDSDQFLEPTVIEQSVSMMEEYDMLCLEEKTFDPKSILQKLFEADRRLIHDQAELQLDPLYGALAPRFYRKKILEKVFTIIPREILPFAKAAEDSIIYFEASKLSKRVGMVPNAVWHQEPKGLLELWRKNHGYGKSARQLLKTGHYSSLVSKKLRLRDSTRASKEKILSSILLSIKGPAYLIGFYLG